jgi:hypothetical protein
MEMGCLMNLSREKDCNLTGINKFGLRFAVLLITTNNKTQTINHIYAGR